MNSTKTSTAHSTSGIPVKDIAIIGLVTAVTCILGPLALPIGPVPISLTNLVIYFSLYILGMKKGSISYVVYLLIGLIGVPVFSGYTGGAQKLFGPTGGYLIGFIPMAILAGFVIDRFRKNYLYCMLAMIAGTAICYALGTAWLAYQAGLSLKAALSAGVIPFIPGDLIKMGLAAYLGPQIRTALIKGGILPN